jgi:CHAD domain-containing protein
MPIDDTTLRRVLVDELHACAATAREAATHPDHQVAVHEFRKALRRARAVLSLVSEALPRGARRAACKALRDARRALSAVRDHAVAPATIASLGLTEATAEVANAAVAAAAHVAPSPGEVAQALAEGAARTAAEVEVVEASLPPAVEWGAVIAGIRADYRAARRARRNAKHSRRAFHTWRRRTKELVYELDLLSQHAPGLGALRTELDLVADTQGPATDLIMLRDLVREHADCEPLLDAIDAQLDPLMASSRDAGREAFKRKPAELARWLTKALRQDATR